MFACSICGKEFETGRKLGGHARSHSTKPKKPRSDKGIAKTTGKGIKKKKSNYCTHCTKFYENRQALAGHQTLCVNNPQRQNTIDKTSKSNKGKTPSLEVRSRISESMKIAHTESRAWNIGMSRWNDEPSYPEKFFMDVVRRNFTDITYIREHQCGIYSFDFAWPHLMKAIEIDGEQHDKEDYKSRDERKDIFTSQQGWKTLRIRWKDMYYDPKKYIELSKSFIDNK